MSRETHTRKHTTEEQQIANIWLEPDSFYQTPDVFLVEPQLK